MNKQSDDSQTTTEKVDPGALLIAVLVVGIAPLTEEGDWEITNTVIAVVVLCILFAFSWPKGRVSARLATAISLVFGFTAAIGLAWPIQFIWRLKADTASYVALVLGGVIASILLYWFTRVSGSVKERFYR